jgi:NADPH:quinone reductase-like Zn-dependent oxidoreductase
MKALVYDAYGPPESLRIEEVERPVPRGDEAAMCVSGTLSTHIDREYALADVPAALRHIGDGRALGKVVISVA